MNETISSLYRSECRMLQKVHFFRETSLHLTFICYEIWKKLLRFPRIFLHQHVLSVIGTLYAPPNICINALYAAIERNCIMLKCFHILSSSLCQYKSATIAKFARGSIRGNIDFNGEEFSTGSGEVQLY